MNSYTFKCHCGLEYSKCVQEEHKNRFVNESDINKMMSLKPDVKFVEWESDGSKWLGTGDEVIQVIGRIIK
jgi:hypothetical protein